MTQVPSYATVKQILTADTFLLVGVPRGGPPPEKKLHLSGIVAPKCAFKLPHLPAVDEPYGFAAREFVRQKYIGEVVEFSVEHVNKEGKEYGSVIFDGKDLAVSLVSNGYAKVQFDEQYPPKKLNELRGAEEEAKTNHLGMWEDSPNASSRPRTIIWADDDNSVAQEFAKKNMHKKVKGIVEDVFDCRSSRVFFPSESIYVPILASGIQMESSKKTDQNRTKFLFGDEAKYFVQMRILQRDVEVRIDGITESGDPLATVIHPLGKISLSLLRNGFVKLDPKTLKFVENPNEFEDALKEGQTKHMRLWKEYNAPTLFNKSEYFAKVIEVVSGDCIIVEDPSSKNGVNEKRLYMASIRCPRPGTKERPDEPLAFEAKEFLRKRIIGKKVKVVLEYTREATAGTLGSQPPPASDNAGNMHFVSIYDGDKRLSELLIQNGYARILAHRPDDDKATNYENIVATETKAKDQQKGVFGPSDKIETTRINQLLGQKEAHRARAYAMNLVDQQITGIVDHVFNASRYKIRIPSMNIAIAFITAGVRCPMTKQKNKDSEPFAEESLMWARRNLMQREVHIIAESCDKAGNFIGLLKHNNQLIAATVLELGYGETVEYSVNQTQSKKELLDAEARGKAAHAGIWSLPDISGELSLAAQKAFNTITHNETYPHVQISHIESISEFYIHKLPLNQLETLQKKINDLKLPETYTAFPRKGEYVLALFSEDNKWYRGRVEGTERVARQAKIMFIDFGNTDFVDLENLKKLPKEFDLSYLPAQAIMCALSGCVEARGYMVEARKKFYDLTINSSYECRVCGALSPLTERNPSHSPLRLVILTEKTPAVKNSAVSATTAAASEGSKSVNCDLLRMGVIRFDHKHAKECPIQTVCVEAEAKAKKAHTCIWKYGDVGYDSDEE